MTRPTDEELETMAERLDRGERRMDRKPADNNAAEAALRREAAALLRACEGRVKVKPLEWREVSDGNYRKGKVFASRSLVSFAPIAVYKKNDGWWLNVDCKTYPTVEAAKAAAQADYEARILAALEQEHRHE